MATTDTPNLNTDQKRLVVERIVLAFLQRAGIPVTVKPTNNGLTLDLDLVTNTAIPEHLARLMDAK